MDIHLETQFEKIIKGQVAYQSTNLGCNLLIARMKKLYESSPTAPQLAKCVQEMTAFFQKYHTIMAADIEKVSKL